MINIDDFIDNRYQILSAIGSGGMADVFLAKDIISNNFVAVKIMKDSLFDDPSSFESFKKEIKITSSLSHPNIVQVFNEGIFNKCPYLITEYFKDQTLADRLDFLTKFSLNESVQIMIQILSAVEYAHNHKLIHRDIKPQNIFYLSNGTIKLGDFGIALDERQTKHSKILGSLNYLAPEIFNGFPYSRRSDIYALGVTFFQLITGILPFEERNTQEIKKQIIINSLPKINSILPDVPESIDEIISRATAKNQANRYSTVSEFKKDLILFQNGKYKKQNFFVKLFRKL